MDGNGFPRFPGNLDPTAQEFRPANHTPPHPGPPFLFPLLPPPPPHVFYPYNLPPAPLYPPPAPEPNAPPLPPSSIPPTRALLLSSVPTDTSESSVRRDLEVFGDVRAVQMGRVKEGIVAVHFYDLRAAHAAMDEIRDQHMQHQHRLRLFYSRALPRNAAAPPPPHPGSRGLVSGRAVWAQFIPPALNAFPDGLNQGTLVVFNLDPQISASSLAHFFQAFGPIRELRETPTKRHQKFVEFLDVRDAARALVEMNGREIGGKQALIEFSRPGGGHRGRSFHHQDYSQSRSKTMKWHPQQPPPSPSPSQRNSPPQGAAPPYSKNWLKSVANNIGGLSLSDNAAEDCLSSNSKLRSGGAIVITKAKDQAPKSRPWKGKGKGFDPRFLIKEDAIVDPGYRDSRTTVMIKNIPNKYSQKLLLNMLDNHCIHCNEQGGESSYDFIYLPIDFNNKCNVGYGFVNMTSPEATLMLYKAFHQQHWEVFNSRKICEVFYARVQGLEALKGHFKNSKFACETEEYLPVVFTPPRDGRAHLTDPLPIVPCLHHQHHPVTASPSASSLMDGGDSASVSASVPSSCGEGSGGNDDDDDDDDGDVDSNGGEVYHDITTWAVTKAVNSSVAALPPSPAPPSIS